MKNNTEVAYSPHIFGETNYVAFGGVAKISGVRFSGTPGSTFKIGFKGSAIDEGLPATLDYIETAQVETVESALFVDVRKCEPGEFFSEDGECIMCPEGKGYFYEAMDSPGSCLPCSEEGNCVEGNKMGPAPGYWRSNNQTLCIPLPVWE